MSTVESAIDELYQRRLDEFIEARTALARTQKGDDAKRVKAQQKPTAVPWAVNQVYWHARPVYDRLAKSGEKLRAAQVAALKGGSADVRDATKTHHEAVAAAVAEATRLAGAAGVRPATDELARTFSALSVGAGRDVPPGRLVKPLQPAGFEALAGLTVRAPAGRAAEPEPARSPTEEPPRRRRTERGGKEKGGDAKAARRAIEETRREREAEVRRERERAAKARAERAAIKKAEAAVARAEAAEMRARSTWEGAKQDLDRALRALASYSAPGLGRRRGG